MQKIAYFRVPIIWDPGRVMYLIVIDRILDRLRDHIMVKPNEKFFGMIRQHVMDHIMEGKEPPEQISSAILNIADDVMAGREINIRAGDYISLMNFARETKVL